MTPDQRRNTMAKIHIAKKDLALDDDTYRAMLIELTGKSSAKDLTGNQLGKVLHHLKSKGWKPRAPKASASQRRQDTTAEATKVRAMWLFLYSLGQVNNPSEAALARYVKRIARVDDLHWADAKAMDRLIETLKKWVMRVLPDRVDTLWNILASTGSSDIHGAGCAWKTTWTQDGTRAGYDKFLNAYRIIMLAIEEHRIRLAPTLAPRFQPIDTLGTEKKEAVQGE